MSDLTFEALANISGHLSSFAASAQDGKVVQVRNEKKTEISLLLTT